MNTLDRVPLMTIVTALASLSLFLSSIADLLPPKYGVPAGSFALALGTMGRLLWGMRDVDDVDDLLDRIPIAQGADSDDALDAQLGVGGE